MSQDNRTKCTGGTFITEAALPDGRILASVTQNCEWCPRQSQLVTGSTENIETRTQNTAKRLRRQAGCPFI